ncbi:MAG: tRNA pseudouridine(55) synthase TruB [Lachnospiraceae bacterium]|nr:tRNA pseudouridine(55) synthase TruB [Lachnospiraceae bacterium]
MDGLINVYKEKGYTSFDVVAKLRGILHQKKIGHTGTLDPDAEGVLPVCLGKATKLCEMLTDKDKVYEAVIKLGARTDTQDMSGTVLGTKGYTGDAETIAETVRSFVGSMEQVPPMYSAVKVHGKKLYELARKGITVDRQPRNITVYSMDVKNMNLDEGYVRIETCVSKGTYIRTLCEDIGKALGCDACMAKLKRTRSGTFEIADSITLDGIAQLAKENRLSEAVTGIDKVFSMPAAVLKQDADRYMRNGNEIYPSMFKMMGGSPDKKAFLNTGSDDICVYYSDMTFGAVYRKIGGDGDGGRYKVFKMF